MNLLRCVLKAFHALCEFVFQDSGEDRICAMFTLMELLSIMTSMNPFPASWDVLSSVSIQYVIAAAIQIAELVPGEDKVGADVAKSEMPSAALALVEQMSMCFVLRGKPPSDDIILKLLRLHASLNSVAFQRVDTHQPTGYAIKQGQTPTYNKPHRDVQLLAPAVELGKSVLRLNNVPNRKTLRLGEQEQNGTDHIVSPHQVHIPGYSLSGKRLPCDIMLLQVTRVLALLLSIPQPPQNVLAAVITSQQAQLHHHAHAFCNLLFGESAVGEFCYICALLCPKHCSA